ncbi:MAG: glycosyltransferase [Caldilineaceae bacterium]
MFTALAAMKKRPPLIEHGGLVSEALAGPKHFTTRYVGVCRSIQAAAASKMPERPHHARLIPSMVDLTEFDPTQRHPVRKAWGVTEATPVIGWVGRLDRKKRVEDFIQAAAVVHQSHPAAHFVIIGGPDAFMPEYADELHTLVKTLQLQDIVHFLGDRPDVPRLLAGLDIFTWLSRGEGMPHVISEAGAAGLPVIATCDNGSEEQICHGETGLFVPHASPVAVAGAIERLILQPDLGVRLGRQLRLKVEREYAAAVVTRRWEALFAEVLDELPDPDSFTFHCGTLDTLTLKPAPTVNSFRVNWPAGC